MASQHIEIVSTASRLSALVRATIDAGRTFQEDIIQIKDIFDQVTSGDDWVSLATKLGTSAADAETVYNLFASLFAAISAEVFNNVLDRLG